MALKRVLDNLDNVPDDVKKEYVEKDGKFHLDLDGEDDNVKHLTTKKQIAEEHRTKAEKRAKELQDELDEMRRGAIPKADVEGLENSWKGKLTESEQKAKDRETALTKRLHKVLVEDRAEALARELSTTPSLLAPVIMRRLAVDEVDGEPVVRVKSADGKMSALTLDDLKTEIKGNTEYAAIMIGSKGNGGGAGGGNGGKSGSGAGGNGRELKDMTDAERTEWYKRDPDGFRAATGRANT